MEFIALGRFGGQFIGLFLEQTQGQGLVDLDAGGRLDAVMTPLPELATTHFGRRGVLLWENGKNVNSRQDRQTDRVVGGDARRVG